MGSTAWGLVGLPIVCATFAGLVNYGPLLSLFALVGSFAAAAAVTAILGLMSGISVQFLGTGFTIDIEAWVVRFGFVATFLTTFYITNIALGMTLIFTIPYNIGLLIFGVLSTLYFLGLFAFAQGMGDQ